MITTVALQSLADALSVPDGGFSVDLETGLRPRHGCTVSIFPQSTRVLAWPVTCQDLIEYVTQHAELLDPAGHLFGGWHDPASGRIYLDVSVWTRTADQAERLGQAHQQLAYFDHDAGKSIVCSPVVL